jgi:tRNA(Arg) A34 adenosine deaminase TadA
MSREEKFMLEAIRLSKESSEANKGGPFGCVIVKEDKIIGRGNNQVLRNSDPTAHAEIMAIRDACQTLGSFQLDDCEVYTSCEPCPMCLGALYWARPKAIYFANSHTDAARIGFDDSMIYKEVCKKAEGRKIPMRQVAMQETLDVFDQWQEKNEKNVY